jgi:rod shape-determining protein MreD
MAANLDARPQRILLPVSPLFIIATLILALVFNLLPWQNIVGLPDMVALVLVFWCVRQPRHISVGTGWLLGLSMDIGNGALLGQHAFAYVLLAFSANALSRRLLWFAPWPQALHVLLLLLSTQLVMLAIRMAIGGPFPGWLYFAGSFIAAGLWPFVTILLLAPQRRPESVDQNRPL